MLDFIQQQQGALMAFFFLLAAVCLFAAIFFAVLMRRAEKKADQRLKQARADITDMTILFQTMRDIIGQQKSLAKEFNEELEHKMEQVKHVLSQGMEKNKQLYEKQERIASELQQARVEIDDVFQRLAEVSVKPAPNGTSARPAGPVVTPKATIQPKVEPSAPPAPREESLPHVLPPRPAPKPAPMASGEAREHVIRNRKPLAAKELKERAPALSAEDEARLADTGVTKAAFSSWIAEDLSEREAVQHRPVKKQPEEPDPAEAGPSNGDAAREAFRALLNMPASAPVESDPGPLDIVPKGGAVANSGPAQSGADDALSSVPLQQRVLEYSEAGMTVAQVSRELGIGKGEVRLMLSLAKQQPPRRE